MAIKLQNQKNGSLSELERLELGRLLLKLGYMVRLGKSKPIGKSAGAYIHYIEFWEDGNHEQK